MTGWLELLFLFPSRRHPGLRDPGPSLGGCAVDASPKWSTEYRVEIDTRKYIERRKLNLFLAVVIHLVDRHLSGNTGRNDFRVDLGYPGGRRSYDLCTYNYFCICVAGRN